MIQLPSNTLRACIICSFIFLGLVIYGSSLQHEFVSWDDDLLIVDNPNVKEISMTTIRNVFTTYDPELYVPMTLMSYQIDDAIGGGKPFTTHVANRFLHIANSLLVAWLLYALLKRGWLAIGLGMLFLIHPLNTEAAVWASSRKDLLSTFFFLSSLLTWLQYRNVPARKRYIGSLILFLFALLSKVMAVTLPLVMILVDLLEGKGISRDSLREKAPFFALSLVFGIIALFGKTKVLVSSTSLEKLLVACKATVFYIMKFLAPYDLSVMYPYTRPITITSADFFVPAILILGALALLWKFSSRSRIITFGVLFFAVTLLPTFTNFSKNGDFYIASDRYAYIPMIGLLILLGAGIRSWMDMPGGVRIRTSRRNSLLASTFCLFVLFGYLSTAQAAIWKNDLSLYEYVLSTYPNARAAHNNLGMEHYEKGDYAAAIKEFDLALAIRKDPKTQTNKAAALVGLGKLEEAKTMYETLLVSDPTLTDALFGIGNIYQRKGDFLRAAELYQKTLDIDPAYFPARNNLGIVYILRKDWDKAIETIQLVIAAKPERTESYYNLAGVYEEKGMKKEAEEMYRKSLELNPSDTDALSRLATLLYDRGEIDSAAPLLTKALALDSSHQTALSLVLRMRKDGVAE